MGRSPESPRVSQPACLWGMGWLAALLLALGKATRAQDLQIPSGCWLHSSGCFNDASVRTLPIGVGGCCNTQQDPDKTCPGDGCGQKLCVNKASGGDLKQCPPADKTTCPSCDKKKLSHEYCAALCQSIGDYRYSGVEYTVQCFCGNELSKQTAKIDDAKCNSNCPGDPTQHCGGGYTMIISEIVCSALWGWTFIGAVVVGGGGYLVGGVLWGRRVLGRTGAGLKPHPHHDEWGNLQALVNDGIHFARGGSSRRRGGGGRQAPLLAAEGGEGRRDGRGGGKPSSRDRGKRGKEAAAEPSPEGKKRSKKSKKKASRDRPATRGDDPDASVDEEQEEEGGPGWSGNAATLAEVREKEVHSSQARVKVVGLNGEG